MSNNPEIKTTLERQQGLLPLVATDEITKSGKISKRLIRQDTKELAIIFCQLNKVGKEGQMTIGHASDLLGVPYTILKDWLLEHQTLIVQSDKEYLARLAHRERVLLDALFNPVDLALQELNNRLINNPDSFTNTELFKLINIMADQYTKVYAMKLTRDSQESEKEVSTDNTLTELKSIFTQAKERLIIDQTPENTP